MERIIGGIRQKFPFPICKTHKLLWPCFEFIAYVDGLDNYEKNILDEIFLKLAQAGVTSDEEACSPNILFRFTPPWTSMSKMMVLPLAQILSTSDFRVKEIVLTCYIGKTLLYFCID